MEDEFMTKRQKAVACAALLFLLAPAHPARAASPDDSQVAAPAHCVFTSAPGAWGKDPAKPEFPALDAVPCKGPDALYVVCRPASGGWMQFKQAQRFRMETYLPGSDEPLARELPAGEVWKQNDAPLAATLWKSGGKDLTGEFGIDKKQIENLCPEQSGDEDEAPPAIVFTMAWGRSVNREGAAGEEAVMEYEPLGSWTLKVDPGLAAPPPQVKVAPPPDTNAVRDAVRNEWPSRYPDFTYLDGLISDSPKTTGGAGGDVFTYAMNVTLQDQEGNQLTCNVRDIRVRRMETGSLQIVDLPFDLIQNCR